jgi:hypothetical protein
MKEGSAISISHHHTASGRPLRVSPAWVGAAAPAAGSADHPHLPVREAVWIWSVRRYARLALWALPAAALLIGWSSLGVHPIPGSLVVELAAAWLSLVAMIALTGAALPTGTAAEGSPLAASSMPTVTLAGAACSAGGWLLLGWAVFRSKLVNPADGVLLMLAAASIGATPFTKEPLPTVGALLLLAAGTGLAWTGSRLIPRV